MTPAAVKISILLLYLRLFSTNRRTRTAAYMLIAFIAAYLFALETSLLFGCRPLRKLSNSEIPGTCINRNQHMLAQASLNIISDLFVLALPIPIALRLRVSTRQKIGVLILFGVGSM